MSETPKMGSFLLDRTKRFLIMAAAATSDRDKAVELTAVRAEGERGKLSFQLHTEIIGGEDDYSIDGKASGPVFGEGLSSDVRSCIR